MVVGCFSIKTSYGIEDWGMLYKIVVLMSEFDNKIFEIPTVIWFLPIIYYCLIFIIFWLYGQDYMDHGQGEGDVML